MSGHGASPGRLAAWGLAVLAGAGAGLAGQEPVPAQAPAAEILWDTYGVPHVFAADPEGLFHASGWAQMHNHGNLLLRLYGQARGRAAEYWGGDFEDSDTWVRMADIPARAARWRELQDPKFLGFLEAFARGINRYGGEHPDRLDASLAVVLPVTAADVLAHYQRVVHFTFVVDPRTAGAAARRALGGSNAWAIGPSRSASGHAMLLANPHLPWGDLFTFMEMQLTAPGIDAYGAVLVGMPTPSIAFNDHLGWTHTVNTHDGADFFELTLARPDAYRWDGEVVPFQRADRSFLVRRESGETERRELTVYRSVHGPVIGFGDGRALAMRVVGLDRPHILQQYWDMLRARDLTGFEAALQRMQNPMFTVIYADRDGHIMHLFGGLTPVRPAGEWAWSRTVPGDTAATLWTGVHPYRDLPRVVDPPSGWLQNANDPPWTTTFPRALDPADFPDYMAPRRMSFRAQRSARMLAEDASISFDELLRYKHSTRLELADRLLDDLFGAVSERGDATARRAVAVLRDWDRRVAADSRGAVLFQAFWQHLGRTAAGQPFAVPWSPTDPRATPDGLAAPAAAAAALAAAARQVQRLHGALDVPWGEVYRLRAGGLDLPASGGPGSLGCFRVFGFSAAPDGRLAASSGDTFVAAVEFSDPLRARVLLSYGNSSQPGSPHRTDQLPLLSRNELRPAWRTRAELEQHLEQRTVLPVR